MVPMEDMSTWPISDHPRPSAHGYVMMCEEDKEKKEEIPLRLDRCRRCRGDPLLEKRFIWTSGIYFLYQLISVADTINKK
jgi:hypothetical protein